MYPTREKLKIDLNLVLDYDLSKQTCITIIEAMIKYVIYQRHQVPIHIDILSKEIETPILSLSDAEDFQMQCDETGELDVRKKIKKMVLQRKQILQNQKLNRRKIQWKNEVNKFLSKFGLILKAVKFEVETNNVKEIVLLLGGSPFSAKEVYRIHLPEAYRPNEMDENLSNRKTLHHMLKKFSGSEQLTKLVNSKCSITKFWVMLSKGTEQSTNEEYRENLIPKVDYSIPSRAKEVNLYISSSQPYMNMDLTPMVKNTIYYIHKPLSKELFPHKYSESDVLYNTYPDLGVVPLLEYKLEHEWLKSSSIEQTSVSKRRKLPSVNTSRICDSPMTETPIVNRHIGTPSPIKILSKNFENIVVNESSENVWFQITHSLTGLKNYIAASIG